MGFNRNDDATRVRKNGIIYLKSVFSQAKNTQIEADLKEATATQLGDDVLDKRQFETSCFVNASQ